MTTENYIKILNERYQRGNATEHSFRGDLQQLLDALIPNVKATNEPKRQACGAPDYILTKNEIPVGFVEAKNIGDSDLEGKKKTGNKEQFDRYKASLNNLIFTDYINFHFYRDGECITKIAIAKITEKGITSLPENFARFENLIKDFAAQKAQTIKSPQKLAAMMAGKARLLADVIAKALTSDAKNHKDSTLKDQMTAFRDILIHDITPQGFADVYAQTIAYGMFAARLHDKDLNTFSREKAAKLVPKSNPFLRKLFGYIAGIDIDDRIQWIVDDLVEIFLASHVEQLLKDYGKATQMEDPIIHFYEDFLAEYDPALRKARGVWYTPAPVVNFIVRAVDDILKTEFDLPQGIADTSKTSIQTKEGEEQVHKVQILDPATGTGTFLAEIIKHIHEKFKGMEGAWQGYVKEDLIPRLNGFELLMASYAMAHLQLDLLLKETGFTSEDNQRLRVFLTNSLEEHHPDSTTLFASWLSQEANEANRIKRDTPVMCVLGNPPYSGESQNKGKWIMELMGDYKKEPGGKVKLKERNPKWINDDYVKFMRYGQHYIEKNGTGILAFINPHGFLDNPTFRGMRWNLLKTYDKIYTLDLHGNSKKKETSPDGTADINVFDIQQGVSINIFVKTGKKKANELGKVFHCDLYGKREVKYEFLKKNSLSTVPYVELPNIAPNYFMVQKDFKSKKIYDKGFKINELFTINNTGIVSKRDKLAFQFDKESIRTVIKTLLKLSPYEMRIVYPQGNWNSRDGKAEFVKKALDEMGFQEERVIECAYRPFDKRYTYYNEKSKGFIGWPVYEVMQHFLKGENVGLVFKLGNPEEKSASAMVSKNIIDFRSWSRPGMQGGDYIAPLYIYPENSTSQETSKKHTLDELQLLELRKEELLTLIEGAEPAFRAVQKMYDSIENPDNEIKKLYKAQKKNLQKLKNELDSVRNTLKKYTQRTAPVPALFAQPEQKRKPNLNTKIVVEIAKKLGLKFTPEKEDKEGTFAPIDILDYIYAVLHSPSYREKYKEFLKIDFPRVPYPTDAENFWQLVALGSELRKIHLLESEKVEDYISEYPNAGTDQITTKIGKKDWEIIDTEKKLGRIWLNEEQYIDKIPLVAWEFYIGGYQPAQKWLKDRKGRTLNFEEILHYQKIIVALTETDRLMKEIDKIPIES
jgi:predicted helicase